MKKNLFFAALAITALVSCSESDYLGDEKQAPNSSNDVGAISFGTGFKAVTRAESTGQAAAALLNNNFVVEGIKTVKKSDLSADSIVEVFDNYNVNWHENTADKTLSNTANWEYVGQEKLTEKTEVSEQSIKYWDFAASQYDFWAYSLGGGSATVVSLAHDATLGSNAYTITGTKENLAKVYISDLVTAYNPEKSVSKVANDKTEPAVMGNEVELKFRSLVTKVRVGLYENIPGYSVKNVKFYPSTSGTPTTTATLFASTANLPSFPANDGESSYTVTFPTIGKDNIGKSDYNKAHVAFASNGTKASYLEFGELSYGTKHKNEKSTGDIWLRINSAEPTWAVESGANPKDYSIVMPNEDGEVLTLKVDYTLESTDGTGETITIYGATALVPSEFTQWKPNYAYTYLFKISDNTNGLSNIKVTDKVGLYPITFDAVVVGSQDGTQETITTVSTPSITTYSVNSNVIVNNEYTTTDSIYVMAMKDNNVVALTDKATLYTITKEGNAYAATEAEVLDALTTYYSNNSGTYKGRDSVDLTPVANDVLDLTVTKIVQVDGDTILVDEGKAGLIPKGKLTAGNYYAFVYQENAGGTPVDKYETIDTEGMTDVKGYYTYDGSTYTQIDTTTPPDSDTTYYDKYSVVSGATYGIKVIKIKASN